MTNDKPTTAMPHVANPGQGPVAGHTLPGARKNVKVLSLEIDENDDLGGDPYNHTGSFCVPEFSDD